MNKKMFIILVLTMIMLCVSACGKQIIRSRAA